MQLDLVFINYHHYFYFYYSFFYYYMPNSRVVMLIQIGYKCSWCYYSYWVMMINYNC